VDDLFLKEVNCMPKPAKVEAVKEIAEAFRETDVYYFVDYRGLTVAEAKDLRVRLRGVGARLMVVKNTLAKIAAAEAGVEGLDELLAGPTAIAYSTGDPVRVAKILQDFIREKKKAAVRGGKLQRSVLQAGDVERLAVMPSREQLLAQMAGAIASPLSGLANVMNAPLRELAAVMGQVREQKAGAAA
jgi:large subunit ribosomal protein L10